MNYKVLVTRKIPEEGIKLLKNKYQVTVNNRDRPLARRELIRLLKGKDAVLCLLTDKMDKAVIKANPQLKIIANYAVGYDNIDVKAATGRGVIVTNVTAHISQAVAEHTVALMMSLARRIVESDKFVRAGKYKGWQPMLLLGSHLKGTTLGIVGLGHIGEAVAEIAGKGLGMRIIYYDIRRDKNFEAKHNTKKVSLAQLLRTADYVTIHVPLFKSTRHLIGKKELGIMKKTAYLINTSRGPVIDERALVSALKKKQIAGAALDVYEKEPRLTPGLTKLDNTILTPHTGSATIEARKGMSVAAARNIMAALSGKRPADIVNPEVLKK